MDRRIHLLLRIALALTFLGHGIFALNGRMSWIPYLTTLGIPENTAISLLPLIGILDLVVATLLVLKPFKWLYLWCFIWTFSTALVRPSVGESWWEFIERGAFYGVSLALYLHSLQPKPTPAS